MLSQNEIDSFIDSLSARELLKIYWAKRGTGRQRNKPVKAWRVYKEFKQRLEEHVGHEVNTGETHKTWQIIKSLFVINF